RAPVHPRRQQPVLRDLQPEQAQHLPRPRQHVRPRGVPRPGGGVRRGVLQPARRRAWGARHHLRRPRTGESRIVCCSLSGFGAAGPRAHQPGYDYVVQGLAGWMSLTGEPGGTPAKTGPSLVDYSGGLVAALALLAGLHAARRDGVGVDRDVSLFDTAMGLIGYPATWHLSAGFSPVAQPRSAHPTMVPFQNFPTADGWIVIACPKDKFWTRLVDALGRPASLDDERFATMAGRYAHRDEVVALLDELLAADRTANWIERLTSAGVPCGPGNDVASAFADPQTAARRL